MKTKYVEQTPPGFKMTNDTNSAPGNNNVSQDIVAALVVNAVPLQEQAREPVLGGTFYRCS
jgi:hypothetical protein